MVRAHSFLTALFLVFTISQGSLIKPIPNRRLPLKQGVEVVKAHLSCNAHLSTSEDLDCYSVQFYLATRDDPNGTLKACATQEEPIFGGEFDDTKTTVILVHGWKNSKDTDFTQTMTAAYLKADDVNVIQVDWSVDADTDYLTAIYRVPEVGQTLTHFVKRMTMESNLDVNNLYLVGFSLGAHVVGIAGYHLSPKVARVIGLDPAGPLFEDEGPAGKLSTESGRFVMTLHTCAVRLGTFENLGHLNFYANSGMLQPGCVGDDILGFCSHNRAFQLLAASLEFPEGFTAVQCGWYLAFELGLCSAQPTTYFRSDADENATGEYYFKTSDSYPFFVNDTFSKNERVGHECTWTSKNGKEFIATVGNRFPGQTGQFSYPLTKFRRLSQHI